MPSDVLRATDEDDPDAGVRVTDMELLFELVDVFAGTQRSDLLYMDQTGAHRRDRLTRPPGRSYVRLTEILFGS